MLKVDVRKKKSVVVISLAGEMDCNEELACREVLRAATADMDRKVVIDLGRLTFMDSTGIKLFLEVDRRARLNGARRPHIRGASPQIMRILNIAGITGFLHIDPDTNKGSSLRLQSPEHPSLWGRRITAH